MVNEVQSLPGRKINLNDNYCLAVPPAPNSVQELSVNSVYSHDFILTAPSVNFANNLLRPPQNKGVSPPVTLKCFNQICKSCSQYQSLNLCNSHSFCSGARVLTLSKAGF